MSFYDCTECGRGTYPSNPAPSTEQRLAWRAEGRRRAAGRGVCVNCYARFRSAGRLHELAFTRTGIVQPADDKPATNCPRCGIKHRLPEELCQDCQLVAGDLNELQAWCA